MRGEHIPIPIADLPGCPAGPVVHLDPATYIPAPTLQPPGRRRGSPPEWWQLNHRRKRK